METPETDLAPLQSRPSTVHRVAEMDVITHLPETPHERRFDPSVMVLPDLLRAACNLFANGAPGHAADLLRYVLAYRCQAPQIWIALRACHVALGQGDRAELLLLAQRQFEWATRVEPASTVHEGGASS